MRFMTRVMVLLTAVCLLSLSPVAFGQAVYGSIFGTITDTTAAAVPDATVTVTDEAKGTSVSVQSNGSGEFTVEHLIPDIYDVKVEAKGFKGYEQKGIQLFADTSVKVTAAEVLFWRGMMPAHRHSFADLSRVLVGLSRTLQPRRACAIGP